MESTSARTEFCLCNEHLLRMTGDDLQFVICKSSGIRIFAAQPQHKWNIADWEKQDLK
jgi:hypothetical protein